MARPGHLHALYSQYTRGELDRRQFLNAAAAAGIGGSMLAFLVNAPRAAAQSSTPEPAFEARPAVNTDAQERGAGGDVKIIQWQAPTILSPHVTTGYKDFDAAQLVVEPLMHFGLDAVMVPNLLAEVPSVENGGLTEDLTSVTLTLLPGLLWSDGEPVTAEDIRFTIEWVLDPANASSNLTTYQVIDSVEVLDEQRAKVTFSNPNPFWFEPFTSYVTGALYPKHILESGPDAHDAFILNPIGTGPYKVESFTPNDQVTYVLNENYREPTKPWFSRVILKGGGDGSAAARAVLQTGEYDLAWGPQVEPDVMKSFISEDGPGKLIQLQGVNVERMALNFSDPNKEVDGQRSEMNTPHPFLTDPAVREAIATAIDRELIAENFYGFGSIAARNVIYGDPLVESENTSVEFNPDKARQILDDAGWVLDGDIRKKDGVELKMTFASSVNSRRQKTQAVVKSNLEDVGIGVKLEQYDAGIFFDASAGNDQNFTHFYWDSCLYIMPQGGPRPLAYCEQWYSGPERQNVAQASNKWGGSNNSRWSSEEYDDLYRAAQVETDPEKLADLFIQMNDMVVNEHVLIPMVAPSTIGVTSKRLNERNIAISNFSGQYWNIANWNLSEDAE